MKVGTANIRNFPDMTPAQVAQDVATVMAHTSLCGLQEIQPREDTPVVLEQLGDRWAIVGRGHETPIVWDDKRWRELDHNVIPFHRPDLSRPENPHGAVTSGIFRSRKRPWLPPFGVVNVHLVAGGFNAQHLPAVQERWRVEWGIVQAEALRLERMGLSVLVLGDLNHHHPPELRPHDRFRWLTQPGTADHVGILEAHGGVQLVKPTATAVHLNSDHDLHVVSGLLHPTD